MSSFPFEPELFEHRATAQAVLAAHGYEWMRDYSTVDVTHEFGGLEICGILTEPEAEKILALMQRTFPDWKHSSIHLRDFDPRDQGWLVKIHRLIEVAPSF